MYHIHTLIHLLRIHARAYITFNSARFVLCAYPALPAFVEFIEKKEQTKQKTKHSPSTH